jgi:hypothetical protein
VTQIRKLLADALHDNGCHPGDATELADALLSLPGIAIVKLPEGLASPDGYSWPAAGDSVFYTASDKHISAVVLESSAGEAQLVQPANARSLAAALLAATEVAS